MQVFGGIHMAAGIVRLRTRGDRLRAEQAATLRQLVLAQPGLPAHAVGQIVAAIDRETASGSGWRFVMVDPVGNAAVVRWLAAHSSRPTIAMVLWAELAQHIHNDTHEVVRTRDELADAVGVHPDNVSRIMGELEACGAISRRRERVAGMRGPGVVKYFLNPNVATHLAGAARDAAQARAPALHVVDGGVL